MREERKKRKKDRTDSTSLAASSKRKRALLSLYEIEKRGHTATALCTSEEREKAESRTERQHSHRSRLPRRGKGAGGRTEEKRAKSGPLRQGDPRTGRDKKSLSFFLKPSRGGGTLFPCTFSIQGKRSPATLNRKGRGKKKKRIKDLGEFLSLSWQKRRKLAWGLRDSPSTERKRPGMRGSSIVFLF